MPETVAILRETSIPLPVAPGVTRQMVAITYAAADVGPRIVYIEPGRDSPEERKRVIAADIKAARAETPNTLEIP